MGAFPAVSFSRVGSPSHSRTTKGVSADALLGQFKAMRRLGLEPPESVETARHDLPDRDCNRFSQGREGGSRRARRRQLRANRTTRLVGEHRNTYLGRRQQENLVSARPHLEAAYAEILQEGKAFTKRKIQAHAPTEALSCVPHLLNVLKEIQARARESRDELALT